MVVCAVLAGSVAFHAYRAEHPTTTYQSADERSYGILALSVVEHHRYGGMTNPLHWPPGAPALFAVAHRISPAASSDRTKNIPAAYWAQAVVSVGTALAAFGLAWALAGVWAGVASAALVGLYPPLILATGEQVSEPFGAFLLTAGLCSFAWAAKRRSLLGYAAAGVLLGAAVLTRADLLFAPLLIAILSFLWLWRGRRDARRGLVVGGVLVAGAALVMVPWMAYASHRAGRFVPVTQGSASPLFVGTYLPGHGHTVGMKRALEADVKRFRPSVRDTGAFDIPASYYMKMIAARHPELPADKAIRWEARHNITKYAFGDPIGFGAMMLDKVQRMWTRYARGGARHTSPWIRGWHIALVIASLAGLLAGLWRRRSVPLGAIGLIAVYSTLLHMVVVSQARYNLPLMPSLVAGGVAGWVLWRRGPRPEATPVAGPSSATAARDPVAA
jgi:4-amino-4-deoxy-L-arabinose transferase-like glycosyltransferase